jgi:hypothetical protein
LFGPRWSKKGGIFPRFYMGVIRRL